MQERHDLAHRRFEGAKLVDFLEQQPVADPPIFRVARVDCGIHVVIVIELDVRHGQAESGVRRIRRTIDAHPDGLATERTPLLLGIAPAAALARRIPAVGAHELLGEIFAKSGALPLSASSGGTRPAFAVFGDLLRTYTAYVTASPQKTVGRLEAKITVLGS